MLFQFFCWSIVLKNCKYSIVRTFVICWLCVLVLFSLAFHHSSIRVMYQIHYYPMHHNIDTHQTSIVNENVDQKVDKLIQKNKQQQIDQRIQWLLMRYFISNVLNVNYLSILIIRCRLLSLFVCRICCF